MTPYELACHLLIALCFDEYDVAARTEAVRREFVQEQARAAERERQRRLAELRAQLQAYARLWLWYNGGPWWRNLSRRLGLWAGQFIL